MQVQKRQGTGKEKEESWEYKRKKFRVGRDRIWRRPRAGPRSRGGGDERVGETWKHRRAGNMAQ